MRPPCPFIKSKAATRVGGSAPNPNHGRWNIGTVVNALRVPLRANEVAAVNHAERSGIVTKKHVSPVEAVITEQAETPDHKPKRAGHRHEKEEKQDRTEQLGSHHR